MPFQREDITPEDRIRLVTTILSQPNQYGRVSDLTRKYELSRQRIYTMLNGSREGLADRLRARPPGRVEAARALKVDKNRLDRAIATLIVLNHASLESVQGCLEEMF